MGGIIKTTPERFSSPVPNTSPRPPILMLLAKAFQTDPRPRQEAGTLVEADYQVHVISWDRECEFNRISNVEGATVHSIRQMSLRRYSRFKFALGSIIFQILLVVESIRLVRRIKQRPVVHVHDFNTLVPGCILKALRMTSGLVYDAHELSFAAYQDFFGSPIGGIVRVIEQRLVQYADLVITVCKPIAKYLRRFNAETIIIYNSPRVSEIPKLPKDVLRAELGLPADAFIVSFVGTINEIFASELLLTVASALREDGIVRFLVVGGGTLASEFWRIAGAVKPQMIILPQVSRARALWYVAASDLTWSIYRNQALNARLAVPWKFFESLACRVPILAEKGTQVAEWVNGLKCGVVVESDPIVISQTISALVDPNGRPKFKFSNKYSWENMSRKLIESYEDMVDRNYERDPPRPVQFLSGFSDSPLKLVASYRRLMSQIHGIDQ